MTSFSEASILPQRLSLTEIGWLLMMVKINRGLSPIVLSLLICACASRSYNLNDIEKMLDSWVGRIAPERIKNPAYWKVIGDSTSEQEIEQVRPDGCSYSILINKQTREVKGWKFTSDKSLCDKNVNIPNV